MLQVMTTEPNQPKPAHSLHPTDPSNSSTTMQNSKKNQNPISLWSYVSSEISRGYLLEADEVEEIYKAKRSGLYEFSKIPRELEKLLFLGFFVCLDTFLFVFTLLPARVFFALFKLIIVLPSQRVFPASSSRSAAEKRQMSQRRKSRLFKMTTREICDLLRGSLVLACLCMLKFMDASRLYHFVRGQAVIKLYVIFNMLEILEKLCSSFGQDILDSLYWTACEPKQRKRQHIGLIPHFCIALLYIFGHSMVFFYQVMTLNVAVNTNNNALLTLLISNQFIELKGNVFKKFGEHNLFQMSCADIVERFNMSIFLSIISIRNLGELNWSLHYFVSHLLSHILTVFASELIVDWIKHAFITKFNKINSDVYSKYKLVLASDLAASRRNSTFQTDVMDHAHVVSRRVGFIPLPLACVLTRVLTQSLPPVHGWAGVALVVTGYLCLVLLKLLISIILIGYAGRRVKKIDSKTCGTNPSSSQPRSSVGSALGSGGGSAVGRRSTASAGSKSASMAAQASPKLVPSGPTETVVGSAASMKDFDNSSHSDHVSRAANRKRSTRDELAAENISSSQVAASSGDASPGDIKGRGYTTSPERKTPDVFYRPDIPKSPASSSGKRSKRKNSSPKKSLVGSGTSGLGSLSSRRLPSATADEILNDVDNIIIEATDIDTGLEEERVQREESDDGSYEDDPLGRSASVYDEEGLPSILKLDSNGGVEDHVSLKNKSEEYHSNELTIEDQRAMDCKGNGRESVAETGELERNPDREQASNDRPESEEQSRAGEGDPVFSKEEISSLENIERFSLVASRIP